MSIVQPPIPVRETPAAMVPQPNPAFPDASAEPVLKMAEIQGNIIPGFNKDYETLLFLRITDPGQCKEWIKHLTPFIATAEEVLAFNQLFKKTRYRRGHEVVKATWVNIAFSFQGLKKLRPDADQFTDQAFKDGLAARSKDLGDPTGENDEGNPKNWVIGGPGNEADILLIVQSDDYRDLQYEVQRIKQSIYNLRSGNIHVLSGVTILYEEYGANPPGRLSGHEHFGFLDGVSQPGIRGRISKNPHDVLTPRQNPREKGQGKPGQDLLWPGEFVFSYEYQDPDPKKKVSDPSDDKTQTNFHKGKVSDAGPTWAENGSFLVFRRLRQDVGAFHTFLQVHGQQLGVSPTFLGAKIVGRWPSGAPILRSANADNPDLGNNDCANNDFEFSDEDPSLQDPKDPKQQPPDMVPPVGTDNQCMGPGKFTASPGDPPGKICPAFGHIRKAYPRNDITPEGIRIDPHANDPTKSDNSERFTQTHRLLRRGLPYGPVSYSTPSAPVSDEVDRGLLFICYQTSIEGQFEFVTHNWVNNPNFKDKDTGFDLVIGQNGNAGKNRVRRAQLLLDTPQGSKKEVLDTSQKINEEVKGKEWVIPTGGGYFFSPSISALEKELVS